MEIYKFKSKCIQKRLKGKKYSSEIHGLVDDYIFIEKWILGKIERTSMNKITWECYTHGKNIQDIWQELSPKTYPAYLKAKKKKELEQKQDDDFFKKLRLKEKRRIVAILKKINNGD